MELLRSNLTRVRIPEPTDRIYKHECCVSFESPWSEGGLFIDMNTFVAFGKDYVNWNYEKTKNSVYLHLERKRKVASEDMPLKKPEHSGIGGSDNELEYEETLNIVILPDYLTLPFPSAQLPKKVKDAVEAIISAEGADRIPQVPDVSSCQVVDFFGIDIPSWKKTALTNADWEIFGPTTPFDRNSNEESGQKMEPICGPGYTGLVNLGNSCYLASTMQVVFSTDSFRDRYYINQGLKEAFDVAPADPTVDLNMQLTKLAHGLLSGKYSGPALEEGIPPRMFKAVIGASHPEYSKMMQQDAMQFFVQFVKQVEQSNASRPDLDPTKCFKFGVEERIVCTSGKVALKRRVDSFLSLNIPLRETFMEKKVSDGIVYPCVSFEVCLESFSSPKELRNFHTTALDEITTAIKVAGFSSFPDYLVIHMRRFVLDAVGIDKTNHYILLPEHLDITGLRSRGVLPWEELLPAVAQKDGDPGASASEMDTATSSTGSTTNPAESGLPDGAGRYDLFGIVTHMNTSARDGHYVAHVKKKGQWVKFNDNKVAVLSRPLWELGYLYFFKRDESIPTTPSNKVTAADIDERSVTFILDRFHLMDARAFDCYYRALQVLCKSRLRTRGLTKFVLINFGPSKLYRLDLENVPDLSLQDFILFFARLMDEGVVEGQNICYPVLGFNELVEGTVLLHVGSDLVTTMNAYNFEDWKTSDDYHHLALLVGRREGSGIEDYVSASINVSRDPMLPDSCVLAIVDALQLKWGI